MHQWIMDWVVVILDMNTTQANRTIVYLGLFGLIITLHFSGIGKLSIYALDEAKNAVAAYEMSERADYILPTFNGEPRYDKPPLHYYFFMLGYKIFGYTPFGARFFSAIAGLFCIGICAGFLKEQFGHRITYIFLFLIAGNIHWMVQFHMAVPDPFLVAFLTTAYLYGFRYYQSNYSQTKYQYYSYISLGLAVLSKGPVALLLYMITFILFMLIQKRFSLKPWFRILPLTLFILIASSWYVIVGWKTGGNWLEEFFLTHNLSRFGSAMEGHGGSFLKTWLFVAVGTFPFIVFLPRAINRIFIKNRKESVDGNNFLSFAALAFLIIILFFSFASTRLPNYTVPAYPWFFMIMAVYLERIKSINQIYWLWGISALFVLLISVGGYFGLAQTPYLSEHRSLALYFLLAVIPLVLSIKFILKRQMLMAYAGISFCYSTMTLVFFLWVMPVLDQKNPVYLTKSIWKNQDRISYYEIANPAFVFYLQRPIPPFNPSEVQAGDLVISRKKQLQKLASEGFSFETLAEENDLFESPITVIVRMNPPFPDN
ncbi:ArnT family glycosyltransferase [Belliella marina]|uniref:ArnT family glycosyltransferase n=1 Tax=Belliella marina TaxID=1644146 RepID=A0ABW4VKR7_9BACT